jgi:hypothetical protein
MAKSGTSKSTFNTFKKKQKLENRSVKKIQSLNYIQINLKNLRISYSCHWRIGWLEAVILLQNPFENGFYICAAFKSRSQVCFTIYYLK